MARAKIINKFGTMVGWNSITMNIFGREMEGISEISYDDDQDISLAYGGGKYPIGKKKGNYIPSTKYKFFVEELMALQKQLPKGTRIQDIPDFDITIVYEFNGETYTDIIRNCTFKKQGRNVKNNDGDIICDVEIVCTQIDWNV
jgi:hypothetical protein